MCSRRILLIDDEPDIVRMIQITITAFVNWQVLVAYNGPEGIHIALTEQPDAILLDVMMPGMDGLETLQKLQGSPQTEQIPVILLTAKVRTPDQSRYADLKVAGFISKPFNATQLPRQIAAYLNWSWSESG
ncbi:MAG: response regulator [Thermostichus sp. BF3_bins_97]